MSKAEVFRALHWRIVDGHVTQGPGKVQTSALVPKDLLRVRVRKLSAADLSFQETGERVLFTRKLIVVRAVVTPQFVQQLTEPGLEKLTSERKHIGDGSEAIGACQRAV